MTMKMILGKAIILITASVPIAQAQVDVASLGMEVTQGLQDPAGGIRLVMNKRTFVRFHVISNVSEGVVATAVLRAKQGERTVTLEPINPGGEILVKPAPNRAVRNDAFLFELPEGFREGTVSLAAEVNPANPDRRVIETDTGNNTAALEAKFEVVPTLNLVIYNIGYRDQNGQLLLAPDKDLRQMADWIARAWPVPNVQFWLRKEDISTVIGNGLPECDVVNSFMASKRLLDLQNPANKIPRNARYYGMVSDAGGFMRGCADGLPGYTSSGPTGDPANYSGYTWDKDGSFGDWYGAHEVAHNYARFHAEFCNAQAGAPYPFDGGRISPAGTAGEIAFGFDIRTGEIYNSNWKDVMTYCTYQWTGKFTYHALMDAFQQDVLPSAQAATKARFAAARQAMLLVVGDLNMDTNPPKPKMQPFYTINDAIEIDPRKPGDYAIVLRKADAEVARYPFTPSAMTSGASDPTKPPQPEVKLAAINELVPIPDGITRVDIEGPGKQIVYTVSAGAAFPVVQITAPAGGETLSDTTKVTWTASDTDSDKLFFTLQYSPDGSNWETIEQNVTTPSATVDRTDLSGSDKGQFRVLATDGIHTTIAVSKPFSVPDLVPILEILSPEDNRTVSVNEVVSLEAYAYDPDSGEVDRSKVKWTSSIDGAVGTGETILVTGLSVGKHTITCTAENDAGGAPTKASITLTVVASRDQDPPAQDALQAGPEAIFLDPANGVPSEVVTISNRNVRNPLNWVATANQPWLKLSAPSGKTPANLTVSVGDLSDVAAGVQSATVTLSNPDKAEMKAVVKVQVTVVK